MSRNTKLLADEVAKVLGTLAPLTRSERVHVLALALARASDALTSGELQAVMQDSRGLQS